ncbi:hypothetical protein LT980_13095 [Citrobacter portucalensis]|uniref:hypothetical protein n=1 Tax=Citrobacter portucalensis TaxID=1639133 RepID=UPI00202CEE3E|nr:hypothetical protein [Citrobacter portucalensis]URR10900.1 hypothetical protein LT980_13095 [Citrobacter portucalensis]
MKNVNLILLGDSTQPQERRMKEALKISKDVKPAAVLDAVKEAYEGTGKKPKLNYAQLSRWRKGLTFYRSPPPEDAVDQYSDLFSPLYQLLENPVIVASIDISEFEQRLKIQIKEREQRLIEARRLEAARIMQEAEERDHRKFTEEFNKIMDKLRKLRKT